MRAHAHICLISNSLIPRNTPIAISFCHSHSLHHSLLCLYTIWYCKRQNYFARARKMWPPCNSNSMCFTCLKQHVIFHSRRKWEQTHIIFTSNWNGNMPNSKFMHIHKRNRTKKKKVCVCILFTAEKKNNERKIAWKWEYFLFIYTFNKYLYTVFGRIRTRWDFNEIFRWFLLGLLQMHGRKSMNGTK